jgi:tetratricopeptide (TPR) repeat protein
MMIRVVLALTALPLALGAQSGSQAEQFYEKGRVAASQGKSKEAMEWFEKAVKLNDTSAIYHLWYGRAIGDEAQKANKLRQPFLARRVKHEFERAVQLDPKLIDARLGLVDFHSIAPGVMGGSMDAAKEQAAEIAKLSPMRGYDATARIARRKKDVAGEEAAYQGALRAAPDSTLPYFWLAGFYRRQKKWTAALDTYNALIKMKPDEMFAYANYGVAASSGGVELERGERELRHFLANPPKETLPTTMSTVRFHLGRIYEQTGRTELAKPEYEEAVKLNPQNREAKKALAALK